MSDVLDLPVNTLADRPGHNKPPLAELLAEELAGDKARADELIDAANTASITTQGDAEKVADLIALIRAEEKAVDRIREERKAPLLADSRLIDATCGAIIGPLARARAKLKAMLDEWLPAHTADSIRPAVAQIGSRREIVFVIDDLPAVTAWLVQHRGGEIAQAARTILGKHLRSLGVEHAADAGITGVTVTITTAAQVR